MSYYFSKIIPFDFDKAIVVVTEKLALEGFGVLTTIDVKSKLDSKLGINFRRYTILGACNPTYAYKALQVEAHIGTMLPCNVIVQELEDGQIEVAAIDPVASMQAIENSALAESATIIRDKLQAVIDSI